MGKLSNQEIDELCDKIELFAGNDEITIEDIQTYLKENDVQIGFEDLEKVVEQFFLVISAADTTKIVSYVRSEMLHIYSNPHYNGRQKQDAMLFIDNVVLREFEESSIVVKHKSQFHDLHKYVLEKLRG